MKTYKTTRARCPNCGVHPDRATFADVGAAQKPQAGDIAICANCAAVNVYADDVGNLRAPNFVERVNIAGDARLQKMVRDRKEMIRVNDDFERLRLEPVNRPKGGGTSGD